MSEDNRKAFRHAFPCRIVAALHHNLEEYVVTQKRGNYELT